MPIWTRASRKIASRIPKPNSLRNKLQKQGRVRWLDVGSQSFEDGFQCLDLAPPESIEEDKRDRYIQLNLLEVSEADIKALGQFDLVRLQHVFEHFAPEDGLILLRKLSRIIAPGGYLLMTVPDLRIHAKAYLLGYRGDAWYRHFSEVMRIPKGAPASFVFSCFAHQHGHYDSGRTGEVHCWCYDAEGMHYQLSRAEAFENIQTLSLWSALAERPFTHNRAPEDLCVLARKR